MTREQQMHQLRNEIADHMDAYREEYAPQIDDDFDCHIRYLRESALGKERGQGWGEFIHLQVINKLKGRPIYIFSASDPLCSQARDDRGRAIPGESYRFQGHGTPLNLIYNDYNHWDWLKPKP